VILGKTSTPEFLAMYETDNHIVGRTNNPWNLDRTPGGSSGGSAAAVAAGCVPMALGSDTGGSIRQPASFCGIVGLKPTYGRVSRYGLLAFASSLDQIGPFTRTVEDAALTLAVVAGVDRADATSVPRPVESWTDALTGDLRGLRVGIPRRFTSEGVDAAVSRAFEDALGVLRALGATLVDVELPHASYGVPVYYLVCTAEASSNLARYDGVKYGYRSPAAAEGLKAMYTHSRSEGFGAEVKRRIMLGTYVLSHGYYDAYYLKALQVRTLVRQDYERAFETVDVVAMPTSPIPPFALGEKTGDPLQMYLADIFTVSANLAGLPAISVPCGLSPAAAGSPPLPIGLQLTGRAFDEATVLRAADAYEKATSWHTLTAPATTS
jgi:aspartyl-tRNA(Asn)/glutamyl-tRNA(Gln) amidotransferase subunit A